jgi:uncharacterized protein
MEDMMAANRQSGTSNRGFASMDQAKQREIARKGGQSVPAQNRTFSRNHDLASQAGRKGGENSHGGVKRENRGDRKSGTAGVAASGASPKDDGKAAADGKIEGEHHPGHHLQGDIAAAKDVAPFRERETRSDEQARHNDGQKK